MGYICDDTFIGGGGHMFVTICDRGGGGGGGGGVKKVESVVTSLMDSPLAHSEVVHQFFYIFA